MTQIFHNPRCGKSRSTLKLLEEKGESVKIVEYLKTNLSKKELAEIIDMLSISPLELIRKGESIFKEQYKGKELTDEEWIDAMIKNPILIERPIVVKDGKAAIGRPPEQVLDIL
ncbi:MAG: arsenate reductase [Cyclobacteriaceae bacterium]|jgi:arsenate reductase